MGWIFTLSFIVGFTAQLARMIEEWEHEYDDVSDVRGNGDGPRD
jgi:hypothetical protein